MPLTQEQKAKLDIQKFPLPRRLHLLSHDDIEQAFAAALESLFGGHYSVHIKSWIENDKVQVSERVEITAAISSYMSDKADFVVS
jgi:hypothetical protein